MTCKNDFSTAKTTKKVKTNKIVSQFSTNCYFILIVTII